MSKQQKSLYGIAAGVLLSTALGAGPALADWSEQTLEPEARASLDLTIYGNNFALVHDRRRIKLDQGENRISFAGVSPAMQPATAALDIQAARPVTLLEQTFAFDLLTPEALLRHSVGQTVKVIRTHPTSGEETVETARVLSANNGIVLQIGDRIETTVPGRIAFDTLPPTLRERPTLIATLETDATIDATLGVRYLTGGFSWQADYIAELAEDDTSLALRSTATITNGTGIAFDNARVSLVAGVVRRAADTFARADAPVMRVQEAMPTAAVAPPETVADLYVYPVARTTSLGDRETKQLLLFTAAKVPIEKEYRIVGSAASYTRRIGEPVVVNAETIVRFHNEEAAGLGKPMPAGVIRVYGGGGDNASVFLGEDNIPHTPEGREIRLTLGGAFDVTATRRQTDFRRQGLPKNVTETSYEIEIRNARKNAVEVVVIERIPGDWDILAESAPHKKAAADRAEWTITVPPQGKATLTYKARVQL